MPLTRVEFAAETGVVPEGKVKFPAFVGNPADVAGAVVLANSPVLGLPVPKPEGAVEFTGPDEVALARVPVGWPEVPDRGELAFADGTGKPLLPLPLEPAVPVRSPVVLESDSDGILGIGYVGIPDGSAAVELDDGTGTPVLAPPVPAVVVMVEADTLLELEGLCVLNGKRKVLPLGTTTTRLVFPLVVNVDITLKRDDVATWLLGPAVIEAGRVPLAELEGKPLEAALETWPFVCVPVRGPEVLLKDSDVGAVPFEELEGSPLEGAGA